MKAKTYSFLFLLNLLLLTNCFAQETWTPTSMVNVPHYRDSQTAVWTGTKMIVWGGWWNYYNNTSLNSGGIYDPISDSWSETSLVNVPEIRHYHSAVWTGSKMIVWGGCNTNSSNSLNSGGIYDPVTNSWISTSMVNAPSVRDAHTAVWTGNKMIVWGGRIGIGSAMNNGGIFDPITNSWSPMSTINAPSPRSFHTAIWTGSKMIVWGGYTSNWVGLNTGGIYDPASDSWTQITTVNAPIGRMEHTAVWSGSKMIIWGGMSEFVSTRTGGIYDPSSNSWVPTSMVNVPYAVFAHSAIWTGSKMIVWGGWDNINPFNDGGIFDPVLNNWTPTTLLNAPADRVSHTAVWTGNKMIIWAGFFNNDSTCNTGGIYYNPSVIGIQSIGETSPTEFSLFQNYPNPFNPSTTIKFDLPKDGNVTIEIFDLLGRVIASLAKSEFKLAGSYKVDWDASGFSSGVYFYKLQMGDFVSTKKMILIK